MDPTTRNKRFALPAFAAPLPLAVVGATRLRVTDDASDAAFADHPWIDRTRSPVSMSTRFVIASGDTVDLSRFRDAGFTSPEVRCQAAADYPPYRNVLVCADGQAAARFLIATPGRTRPPSAKR